MNVARYRLARELFAEALEKADAAERRAWVAQACGQDVQLRQSVEALLRAYEAAGAFLEQPAAGPFENPCSPDPGQATAASASLTERPGDNIGPYKLLQPIGEGGCGVVYMAEQHEPIRRKVALKVIKLGMDTRQVVARFEAERQALARMDHPNIAKVLDAGATQTGRPYFVMELVRGQRITAYSDANNLSTAARLDLFIQVCHAIQHAHQKGVIHRDIKPSNILVTVVDGRAVPKVIDFGIAKAIGEQLTDKTLFTGFAQFIGTPAYMSPEQAQFSGADVDTRSDIYSLGVLLYELLTGHTPFDPRTLAAAGIDEMRRIIRQTEPPKPSTRLSTLDETERTTVARRRQAEPTILRRLVRGDLDWIVMKCLEKDRARRYETANNIALDVQRHLTHEPVSARPPSKAYLFQKLVRRNKLAFAAAASVLAAVVVGLGGATWMFFKERAALQRAVRAEAEARQKEQDARAVIGFFQDTVLAAARPEGQVGGLGHDVTVRRAVEAAEPRIAASFTNRAMVEAAIRQSLGVTFQYLGDYSNAVVQFERASVLRRAHFSQDPQAALESMGFLADAYLALGQPVKALPLAEETLRLRATTLGPDHPATIMSMIILAKALRSSDRLEEALSMHQEAFRRGKEKLGATHSMTRLAMNSLASAYRRAGRISEALPLQQEVVRQARELSGPHHPHTLYCISELALSYQLTGQMDKAVALREEVVRMSQLELGREHHRSIEAMRGLAECYRVLGRTNELITLNEERLAVTELKLGLKDAATQLAFVNLVDTYRQSGRAPEAYVLCQRWAAQGSDLGQLRLGLLQWFGQGVATAPAEALKNFLRAAEQGNAWACACAARMYELGDGIPQDLNQAEAFYVKAVEAGTPQTLNDIAWDICTTRQPRFRSGARAVLFAEKAVAVTKRKAPQFLGTLAAAYAEIGQFEKAVAVQQEAMALVADERSRKDYEARLKLYTAQQPYRQIE